MPSLEKLLRPESIAIIGASPKPGSLGASVLDNIRRFKYSGAIYLINPQYGDINGHACYPSIDDLPVVPDSAVLAVSRHLTPGVLQGCADRGVGSAVLLASGFAEQDEEGAALQEEIVAIARDNEMPVLGPNCLGLVNYADRTPMLFGAAMPAEEQVERGVSVISQSGAMAAVIRVALQARGIDITCGVSTGNEAVVGIEDILEFLLADGRSPVIAVLAEQIRKPAKFLRLASKAAEQGTCIVLLHLGRSAAGQAAAASHTGALSGDYAVMEAAVTAAGVTLVDSLEALIDVAELQFRHGDVRLGRAAVVTESGAFRGLTLDYCEALGLPIPAFKPDTISALREVLPPIAQAENPLDLTAAALVDPDLYGKVLNTVFADETVDSAILVVTLPSLESASRKLPPILDSLRGMAKGKPVIFAMLGEDSQVQQDYIDQFRAANVAFFRSPERVLRALTPTAKAEMRVRGTDLRLIERPVGDLPASGVVPEYQAKAFLAAYGIDFPQGELATSAGEAVAAASRVDGPVVMKIQSPDIPHKSDIGGVALNLNDADEVTAAYEKMLATVSKAAPQADIKGVLVEPMMAKGVEMIMGVKTAPGWGAFVLAGFGGVTAELIRDVAVFPADASEDVIRQALGNLRGAPLLAGYRGAEPCDIDALISLAMALGRVARENPRVSELDLNPVVVSRNGAVALDALMVVEAE